MNLLASGSWSTALIIASFLLPRDTLACTPTPPGYLVAEVLPADNSSGVPTDSGLLVRGQKGPSPSVLSVTIEVKDKESGSLVPGSQYSWGADVAWTPDGELGENRSYEVFVVPAPYPGVPADGIDEVSTAFRTGGERTPNLQLAGVLSGSFQHFAPGELGCSSECFSTCPDNREVDVVGVRLTVPRVQGGQGAQVGYQARLFVSANTDVTTTTLPWLSWSDEAVLAEQRLELSPGTDIVVDQRLPNIGHEYIPCFTLVIWDLSGQTESSSICLDETTPSIEGMESWDTNGEVASRMEAEIDQGFGCSTSGGPSPTDTRVSWLLGVVIALGIASRTRRRMGGKCKRSPRL